MSGFQSLKGKLLLAEAFMEDPHFARTVVLLFEHSPNGAAGLVLNRISPLRTQLFFPDLAGADPFLFQGGPVSPEQVFMVHANPDLLTDADWIADSIYFGGNKPSLETVLSGQIQLNQSFRLFAGYSGWTDGQLEEEINQKAWYVGREAKLSDVFSNPETLWQRLVRSMGPEFEHLATAPRDPNWN